MTIFKISYIPIGCDQSGSIANSDHKPEIGEVVHLGDETFEIIEVLELMPPRGGFHYYHVTCRPILLPQEG